jgi:GT2 family glycosyltransferase
LSPNTSHQRHVVTAVIITHDGARLLPGLVQGLRDQTHPAARAIGVDTGSRDRSGALLAELLGSDVVFGMEPGTGYGAAVARALQHPAARRFTGGDTEWIWLLHDDCLPEADALEQMLRVAGRNQSVAILGPKLRDLADRRVLRETGLTIDRAGRRLTGIEPGEIDQGQHDGNRGVLGVSTAGMLVRRDVWEQLGGFDPLLPLFRDDIDFCWRAHAAEHDVRIVTDAIVYHRELSARQSRKAPAAGPHPRKMDRRGALYVLAANLPFWPMLTVLAGCVTGSLLRATYFLLTKQQRRALDHLGAVAWLFSHPLALWRARRRRRANRKRGWAVLKAQVPHGRTLARLAESAAGMLSRSSPYEGSGEHGGMSDDPDDDLPLPPPDSLVRRVLTHPGVLLFLALTLITAIAERSLISSLAGGSGTLAGGALVPAWGGASDLWHEYLAGFHSVGIGSAASAPPYLAVIAALSTLLGGKPWLAVDVLLLGCVPIAGMAAYVAARRVTQALAARIWIAVTYALAPVAMGAIAAGRLGSAVVFMLAPPIAIVVGRMLTRPRRIARRAAWAAGLLVALAAAFVPLVWPIALAGAVIAGVTLALWRWRFTARWRWQGWDLAINAAIVAAVPAAVLMPWTCHLFADPSALLLEAGIQQPGLAAANLKPAQLLMLSPGGPGLPPFWITAGLVLPAFCGLLVHRRRNLVLAGWGVALSGLCAAAVVSRLPVTSSVSGSTGPAWPGIPLAIAAAGLLLAATPVFEWATGVAWGVAASSASLSTRARLVGRRGLAALLLGAIALTAPLFAAAYWLNAGVRGPLSAAGAQVLPAFIPASSAVAIYQNRTLVLRDVHGVLTYQLLRDSDPVLGDPELTESATAARALSVAVASLVAPDSGDAEDAGQSLGSFDIGYVLVPAPVSPALATQLGGQAGLQLLTASSAYDLWRVAGPVAQVLVLSANGTVTAVPSGTTTIASSVGGTLELAEPAGGWSASLNGRPLQALARPLDGWAQGFVLPAGGGRLAITRDNLARELTLGLEVLAVLAAFVLALPGTKAAAAAVEADVVAVDSVPEEITPAEPPTPARLPEPAYQQSAYEQPAYEQPAYEQPAYEQPAYQEPAYEQPAWEQPAYDRPAYEEPAYQEPAWEQPAYEQPAVAAHAGYGDPVPLRYEPPAAPPRRSAPPPPAAPRKGGSHRAARHGKPARGWRGRKSDGLPEGPEALEDQGRDTQQLSDDLSLAMPTLFAGPAEGGVAPAALQQAPADPWLRTDPAAPDGTRPPWETGGTL